MKKFVTIAAAIWSLSTLAALQPAHAATPQCPTCKMSLSTKKDAMHSAAVKIKGKTYYCCSACGAHKAPASKPAHKTTAKKSAKSAALPLCPTCKSHHVMARKDAAHPHMVKINGKTYYSCCAAKKG
jgi:YHS domain-containing protein